MNNDVDLLYDFYDYRLYARRVYIVLFSIELINSILYNTV
jgi:hypothetical protein